MPGVRPENSKRLKVLTCSSPVLILDPCDFDPAPAHCDEVSDDATCHLCLARLCHGTVSLTSVAAPGTPRAAASARGLGRWGAMEQRTGLRAGRRSELNSKLLIFGF
jgi:hypothetical protein